MREPDGYKDFFHRVSRNRDTQEKTVREWWNSFYDQAVTLLFLTGKCVLPGIGTLTLVEKDEQVQRQVDSDGIEHLYVVPARDYPIFCPEDDFINDVNMQGVTKKYRKRLKSNSLTQRDYLRIQRAEKMNVSPVDVARKKENACKEDFSKRLEKKKKETLNDGKK